MVTASAKNAMSAKEAFAEIVKLNPGAEKLKLIEIYQTYEKHFQDFRSKFMKKSVNLSAITDWLKEIANSVDKTSESKVKDHVLRLVAGLAWLRTVNMSKLADANGYHIESGFELSPSPLNVLECLCLLGLAAENIAATCARDFLTTLSRRVVEIPDEHSKSVQICFLASVYGLLDYDVTVVCSNEYLMSKEEDEMSDSFGAMQERLGNIRFVVLESVIREQIDPTENYNERPETLMEQIVYKGVYDSQFGVSNKLSTETTTNSLYIFEDVDTLVSSRIEDTVEPITFVTCDELAKAVKLLYKTAKQIANRFKVEKKSKDKKKQTLEKFQLIVKRNTTMENFETIVRENKSFAEFIDRNRKLFIEYSNELWTCALQVANLYSDHDRNQEKSRQELSQFLDENSEILFRLSKDGSSCEYCWKNQWTSTVYPSYLNAFFYLELFSRQSQFIFPNPKAFGYMKLSCGPVYFNYLIEKLSRNSLVFGLSSSLRSNNSSLLSDTEKAILNKDLIKVKDENVLFFPSFIDQSVTSMDIKILENRENWINTIQSACEELAKLNKAVLVFFRNENDLKLVYERLLVLEPFLLTNNEISINKYGERKVSFKFNPVLF